MMQHMGPQSLTAQHPHRPGRYAALFPSQARNTGAPWSRRRRICRRTACSGVCVKTRRTSWRSAGSGIRRRLSASVQALTTFLLCFGDRQLPKGQVWRPRMNDQGARSARFATSTCGALVLFCSGSRLCAQYERCTALIWVQIYKTQTRSGTCKTLRERLAALGVVPTPLL